MKLSSDQNTSVKNRKYHLEMFPAQEGAGEIKPNIVSACLGVRRPPYQRGCTDNLDTPPCSECQRTNNRKATRILYALLPTAMVRSLVCSVRHQFLPPTHRTQGTPNDRRVIHPNYVRQKSSLLRSRAQQGQDVTLTDFSRDFISLRWSSLKGISGERLPSSGHRSILDSWGASDKAPVGQDCSP